MQRKSITFAEVLASAQQAGLPVAAHEGQGIYRVPSREAAGVVYTVVLGTAGSVCSCPAPVGTCWHGARAQEIAAATEAARKAAVIARGDAAAAEICGRRKGVAA